MSLTASTTVNFEALTPENLSLEIDDVKNTGISSPYPFGSKVYFRLYGREDLALLTI
jgi:hypothetical protein